MIIFDKEQAVLDIGGTKFGGQPGEWPTVMCGSIFYDRHKIVQDAAEGLFDKAAAKQLVEEEGKLAERFGMQRMPDVVGSTPRALAKYVDFMLETIDGPMLVDSASFGAILQTLKRYQGSDVLNRLVLSPIDLNTTDEQYREIAEIGVKNALIMAFSPDAVTPEQKVQILQGDAAGSGLSDASKGLLQKVKEAGVENVLVDVGVIDLMGTAWSGLSISKEKEVIGLPAGCAPANALFSWQRGHGDMLETREQICASGASVYASTIYMGADFVLYGPMSCSNWAYPACAVADALVSYGNRTKGVRAKDRSHPLYKLK